MIKIILAHDRDNNGILTLPPLCKLTNNIDTKTDNY